MTDVHAKIHDIKSKHVRDASNSKPQPFNPIKPVAELITQDSWMICFDEFQVCRRCRRRRRLTYRVS